MAVSISQVPLIFGENRDEKCASGAVSSTKEFIHRRKLVAYKNVIELNDARRDRSEIFRSVEDVLSDVRVRNHV